MVLKLFLRLFLTLSIYYQVIGFGGPPCGGHTVDVRKVEHCKNTPKHHFQILNITVRFNPECEIIPRYCFKWKGRDMDTVEFEIKKDDKPLKSGTEDLCKGLESEKMKDAKETYPVMDPFRCPLGDVKEGIFCITQNKTKVNVPAFAWGFAKGHISGRMEMFDSKANPDIKTCVRFDTYIDQPSGKNNKKG